MPLDKEILGTRFGRYRVVEKIGLGGMAEVYRAETSTAKAIAIKKILSNFTQNPKFIGMFLDEAKIMITLKHPNIVELYDFGKINEVYYLAMEWIDGKPLSSIVKRQLNQNMMFPIGIAVYIAMEISSGLDYAHNRKDSYNNFFGIVHRDVSPPNILISWTGDVKIADFGIAKAANKASLTKPGILKGKFSYMSPEQANGEEIDRRSDVFSLGIVLYEMLTGTRLFLRDKEFQTIDAVRKDKILSPRVYNPEIPEDLETVIMKVLDRNIKTRYQSADEFGDALEGVLVNHFPDLKKENAASFIQFLYPEREIIADKKKRMESIGFWSEKARSDSSLVKSISSRIEKSKRGLWSRISEEQVLSGKSLLLLVLGILGLAGLILYYFIIR